MLCHQAAPGEGGRQLGVRGGEAQVAHQRLHEADARAGAVDGGDDRLGDRQRQCLGPALGGRPAGAVAALAAARGRAAGVSVGGPGPRRLIAYALQVLHVGSGAEAAAGSGDDDHPHVGGGAALFECIEVLALHLGGPRVEALGPVEREQRDAVGDRALHDAAHAGWEAPTPPSRLAKSPASRCLWCLAPPSRAASSWARL